MSLPEVVPYASKRVLGMDVSADPWTHGVVDELLPRVFAGALVDEVFAQAEFALARRDDGAKTYSLATRRLSEDIGPYTSSLLQMVASSTYRDALAQRLGRDISSVPVAVDAWRYGPGDWLSAHVDKPEKLLTQVLYLSSDWASGDGGHLALLKTSEPRSVVKRIEPVYLRSVFFVPGTASWHSVEPPALSSRGRQSLTVTYLSHE